MQKQINLDTPVWHEELEGWTNAGKIEEIKSKLPPRVPPPFVTEPKVDVLQEKKTAQPGANPQPDLRKHGDVQPKKKGSIIRTVLLPIAVVIIVFFVVMSLQNHPNAIPGVKLEINTPKPIVLQSRADNSKSNIKMRTTIYTTVQNQGGSGNAMVVFHLTQDGNTYDRTKTIFLNPEERKDVEVTFDEVRRLGGDITYQVDASAQ